MTPLRPAPTGRITGEALETSLDWLHQVYRRDGLARVHHVGQRARMTNSGPVAEKGDPDYLGFIEPSGRGLVFDAKSCQSDTYYHDVKERAHQIIAIWDAFEAGAAAGILVCNLKAGAGWWLRPWPMWGAGNFHPVKLEPSACCIAVPTHPDFVGGFVPDYLEVAK